MFQLFYNKTDYEHWAINSPLNVYDCCKNMKTIEILDPDMSAIFVSNKNISKIPISQDKLKDWNKYSNLGCKINGKADFYYIRDIIVNNDLLCFHVSETNCLLPFKSNLLNLTDDEKKIGMLIEIPKYKLLETKQYYLFNLRYYEKQFALYEVITFYPKKTMEIYNQAGQSVPTSTLNSYSLQSSLANVIFDVNNSSYVVDMVDSVDTSRHTFEYRYPLELKNIIVKGNESGNDGKQQDNAMCFVGKINIVDEGTKKTITNNNDFDTLYEAVYKHHHPPFKFVSRPRPKYKK